MQNLLSTNEASRFIGVSPQTLISYSKSGKITASFVARRWKYRLENLQAFVDASRRSA
jgi:predicted site-specific integrase-resolvase